MEERTCDQCGGLFRPKRRDHRFCRKSCSSAFKRKNNPRTCEVDGCESPHLAKGRCGKHYMAAGRSAGEIFKTTWAIRCEGCGVEHRSTRKGGRFCSLSCRDDVFWRSRKIPIHVPDAMGPGEFRAMVLLLSIHARREPRPRVWYGGDCAWCGGSFVDWQPQSRHCSPRCQAAHAAARRRKRKGVQRLDLTRAQRVAIYERDKWTCQLCVEPVEPELMDTDPSGNWAPSLDHIVCRAHGGSDDPENLRLTHRWCNAVRGDETYYTAADLVA